jgi:hypothetical protein
MSEHELEYVALREVSDPSQLAIYQSVLEGAGIPFEVEGANTLSIFPVGGAVVGEGISTGLKAVIYVPRSRQAEAEDLLSSAAITVPGDIPGADDTGA